MRILEYPALIDEILAKAEFFKQNKTQINGVWYCARSLPYYSYGNIISQVWHSWLVLRGKAIAFQFAQDRDPNVELSGKPPRRDDEKQ